MDFIVLKNIRISASNISHFFPIDLKKFFRKEIKYCICINLKTNKQIKIIFESKKERDIFLSQMDNVLLSYFKK